MHKGPGGRGRSHDGEAHGCVCVSTAYRHERSRDRQLALALVARLSRKPCITGLRRARREKSGHLTWTRLAISGEGEAWTIRSQSATNPITEATHRRISSKVMRSRSSPTMTSSTRLPTTKRILLPTMRGTTELLRGVSDARLAAIAAHPEVGI